MTLDKASSDHKRYFKPNGFRHYRVVKDSMQTDILFDFALGGHGEDDPIMEYEGDSRFQFYPTRPYIGCANNHLSVISDYQMDLANCMTQVARQALFR